MQIASVVCHQEHQSCPIDRIPGDRAANFVTIQRHRLVHLLHNISIRPILMEIVRRIYIREVAETKPYDYNSRAA
jgi:hypothetical protein